MLLRLIALSGKAAAHMIEYPSCEAESMCEDLRLTEGHKRIAQIADSA